MMILMCCDLKQILFFSIFLPNLLFYKIVDCAGDSGSGYIDNDRIAITIVDSIGYDAAGGDINVVTNSENYDQINQANFLKLYFNNDNENIYKANDEREKRENGCILGTADKYLNWWITESGKINCYHYKSVSLDLSESYTSGRNYKTILSRLSNKTAIRFLSLANNNLSVIPFPVLRTFNNTLEYLSLANNQLVGRDGSPWSIFPMLNKLLELDLRNCSLQYLFDNSFITMSNLRKLYLSNNKFRTIPATTFEPLKHLNHLDLSYIENTASTDLFEMHNPYTIYTDGLQIEYGTFNSLTKLKFLDVSFTKLAAESGQAFSSLSENLRYLSLCHTGFQIIPPRMFNNTNITILDLSGNPMIASTLYNTSLQGLENKLEILAFDDANIKSLAWLRNLVDLKMLSLRGNNINILTNATFKSLVNLIIMDLSFNHISNWYHRIFENNTNLMYMNLRDNNINFMTSEMFDDFTSLQFLAIGSNSFLCDCLLRTFIDLASRSNCNVQCTVTQSTDYSLHLEREASFETTVSTTNNFDPTSYTTPDTRHPMQFTFEMLTDATLYEIFEKFYSPMEKSYHKMYLYNRKYYSNNGYEAKSFSAGIDTMTLRSSNLTVRIKSDALELICKRTEDKVNCPDDDSGKQGYFQLLDFDEFDYRCINLTSDSEPSFHEVDHCLESLNGVRPDTNEDVEEISQSQIISIVVAIVILSIVFYIICYYKWWYIRYFFILIKNATILSFLDKEKDLIKRENENENFMYDVFVSYCEENRDWVLEEFIPNIENSHQINVCLHERDFQVGLSILENIISCMDRSRALLLIVSENFLLSHWCQFEMHLAQYRLLETRREHLIIVLLEDIPKRKRPKTLHYLMKIKTYIKWPTGNKKHPFRSKAKNKNKLDLQSEIISPDDAVYEIEGPELNDQSQNNSCEKDAPNVPEKLLADERNLFWKRLKKALGRSGLKINETGPASFV